MPEFFIPDAESPERAEEVLEAIKTFCADQTNRTIGPRRIYHLNYRHNGEVYDATVGKIDRMEGEMVIAILDAGDMYFVTTVNRGVVRGFPILVGKADTMIVTEFD